MLHQNNLQNPTFSNQQETNIINRHKSHIPLIYNR